MAKVCEMIKFQGPESQRHSRNSLCFNLYFENCQSWITSV